jgi:hypothetical protein
VTKSACQGDAILYAANILSANAAASRLHPDGDISYRRADLANREGRWYSSRRRNRRTGMEIPSMLGSLAPSLFLPSPADPKIGRFDLIVSEIQFVLRQLRRSGRILHETNDRWHQQSETGGRADRGGGGEGKRLSEEYSGATRKLKSAWRRARARVTTCFAKSDATPAALRLPPPRRRGQSIFEKG